MPNNHEISMLSGDPLSVMVDQRCSAWLNLVPDAKKSCYLAATAAFYVVGAKSLGAEISVVLADDAFVQYLNKAWRQKDEPTNVLAFPSEEHDVSSKTIRLLGDIVVASGVVEREASDQNKDPGHHLAHMVVHGALHLLGYDHLGEQEADRMEGFEIMALAALGIDDPYLTDLI